MMPHSRHFVGANSVTNIELNKGFLPAPIVENEHWLENPRSPVDCPVSSRYLERCSGSSGTTCAQ